MKKLKKIGSFLMAVIMTLSVSACGGTAGNPDSGNNAGTVVSDNTAKNDETSANAAADGTTTDKTPEDADITPTADAKVLVVYFSASGSTRRVAEAIAEASNADIFELVPVNPYTSADLSWTTDGSRVNREHDDESLRDIELQSTTVENWDDYDTVLIGYPIWWGIAAWSVNGFVKANDFTGKTVIPFCTSASSGIGQSGKLLADMAGTGDWQEGQRFSSGASDESVAEWVKGLGLLTEK